MSIFWGSTLVALMMGLIASFVRVKASARPTNAKKILIPPLAMSTGMLQFLVPAFRLTWLEVGEALIVGLIFSVFLIKTSNFEKRDGEVYLSRSKAFFVLFDRLGHDCPVAHRHVSKVQTNRSIINGVPCEGRRFVD